MLVILSQHLGEEIIAEGDRKLILEAVPPEGVLGQLFHGAHKAAAQEVLAHLQTLQLSHRLDLLLSASTRVHECVVLLFNAANFSLNLLLPVVVRNLLPLLILVLELANLVQL